jgi:hypothetical protein
MDNTTIVETLNLKSCKLNFVNHHSFPDSIKSEFNFDNGYGISVITKSDKRKSDGYYSSSFSAQGSWEKGTFELGITQKDSSGDYVFNFISDIDDYEYKEKQGIWINLTKEEMEEKIDLIKSL